MSNSCNHGRLAFPLETQPDERVPVSYRTMVRLCQSLRTDAEPKVGLLLDNLCSEIENAVLGEGKMEREAKDLIRTLWSDAEHRKAMRLALLDLKTPSSAVPAPIQSSFTFLLNVAASLNTPPKEVCTSNSRPAPLKAPMSEN